MVPEERVIPLTRPALGPEELAAVKAVLDSGMLVQSSQVAALERLLRERLGVSHALAVSTGTTAIHLALAGLGIGPGDEVVVPDFCFPSVAAAVMYTGALPVLCDVDPATYNLDLERIGAALTPATRAVLAVHQFGIPCGASALNEALDVPVVEDAACALGARDDGGLCGTQTAVGCFSFHPRKVITTAEGGLVTTQDPELGARIAALRSHGMVREDGGIVFEYIGYPGRMSDIHAAIGVVQMGRLQSILDGRNRAAQRYRVALADVPGAVAGPGVWHPGRVYQSLVIRVDAAINRNRVVASLREQGIESTIGTYSIHRQRAFADTCRVAPGGLLGSITAADTTLTLPLWHDMGDSDIDRVTSTLRATLSAAS